MPTPAGLVRPIASAAYEGLARDVLLAAKERRQHQFVPILAAYLAASVQAHGIDGPVVLVPVPSRRTSIRDRGIDLTAVTARRAADLLVKAGHETGCATLLAIRGGVADQAGLTAVQRAANVERAFMCPSPRIRALASKIPAAHVVVCDDVITTGATAREAQRALTAVGLSVRGIAAVAATHRRKTVKSLGSTSEQV